MVKTEPSTGKGEQTRALIFESALALFRGQGFDETTMQQVAERANVAKGAAYYYFPSKEAIIQAYYESLQAEQERLCGEVFATTKHLRARLDAAMQIKFDLLQNGRKLLGVVFRYTGEPEHPLSCLGDGTAEIRRHSMQMFRDALEVERLPPDLRQLIPPALWCLQMGLLVMLLYDNSKRQEQTRTFSRGAVRLTLRLLILAKLPVMKPMRIGILRLLRDARLISAVPLWCPTC